MALPGGAITVLDGRRVDLAHGVKHTPLHGPTTILAADFFHGWSPCQCQPAREAAERGRGLGHLRPTSRLRGLLARRFRCSPVD